MINRIWELKQQQLQGNGYVYICKGYTELYGKENKRKFKMQM